LYKTLKHTSTFFLRKKLLIYSHLTSHFHSAFAFNNKKHQYSIITMEPGQLSQEIAWLDDKVYISGRESEYFFRLNVQTATNFCIAYLICTEYSFPE